MCRSGQATSTGGARATLPAFIRIKTAQNSYRCFRNDRLRTEFVQWSHCREKYVFPRHVIGLFCSVFTALEQEKKTCSKCYTVMLHNGLKTTHHHLFFLPTAANWSKAPILFRTKKLLLSFSKLLFCVLISVEIGIITPFHVRAIGRAAVVSVVVGTKAHHSTGSLRGHRSALAPRNECVFLLKLFPSLPALRHYHFTLINSRQSTISWVMWEGRNNGWMGVCILPGCLIFVEQHLPGNHLNRNHLATTYGWSIDIGFNCSRK